MISASPSAQYLSIQIGKSISPGLPLAISNAFRLSHEPKEIPFVIHMIHSGKDADTIIHSVLGDDVQMSIDAIDEARSTLARHRSPRNPRTQTLFDTFCRIGNGWARSSATDPKEMPQSIIQAVWSPRTSPECHAYHRVIRHNWPRIVHGRVCRRVEGR